MATVCAGTMALMDAGIKIKKPVSGIAMGLISENDKFAFGTEQGRSGITHENTRPIQILVPSLCEGPGQKRAPRKRS